MKARYILLIMFAFILLCPGVILLSNVYDSNTNEEVSQDTKAESISNNDFNLEIGVKLIGATTNTYSNQGNDSLPADRYFYNYFSVYWLDETGSDKLGQGTIEFDTNESDSTVLKVNGSDQSPRTGYINGCQTFYYHYDVYGFLGIGIVRRLARINLTNSANSGSWSYQGYELNDGSMVSNTSTQFYVYRVIDDKEYVSTSLPNSDDVSRQLHAKVILVYRYRYTLLYNANGGSNAL